MVAIKTGDTALFVDLGAHTNVDINFVVPIIQDPEKSDTNKFTTIENTHPLMLAVANGQFDIIQLMLQNKTLNINCVDSDSGVNAFWIACLYEHGPVMSTFAEHGVDILNKNK